MTITELFDSVIGAIGDAFDRVGLAFGRTFDLVAAGAFADLMLWDVAIVLATVFVGLCILVMLREVLDLIHLGAEWFLEFVHKTVEAILDGFQGGLTRIYRLVRKALKR